MTTHQLNIKYCNNIEQGKISLTENTVNIKYAINGTGKTTIWKAIEYYKSSSIDALDLQPFKYRWTDQWIPNIEWIESFQKVMIFNDSYIEKHAFKDNELLENSFQIFFEDERYKQWIQRITDQTQDLRQTFEQDQNIEYFWEDLEKLIKSRWTSKTSLGKAWTIMKALGEWNKLENIPDDLKLYTNHIKSEQNIAWLQWFLKWEEFHGVKEWECPYCTSDIQEKVDAIIKMWKEYDKNRIQKLHDLLKILEWLMEYFSPKVQQEVQRISLSKGSILDDDKNYIVKIIEEAIEIEQKLKKIKNIHFHSLKDIDDIEKEIQEYIINFNHYNYFISEYAQEKIESINQKLRELQNKISHLKGLVNKQNQLLKASIDKYKIEINYFLQCAGYKYEVDSIEQKGKYIAILKHIDGDAWLNAKEHLSFWEKNALALILFMYQCISEKADLIILDDPISSFDQNKKFAMLNMLFNGYECEKNWQKIKGESLRSKTILMMTHDFEPVLDLIYNHINNLQIPWKTAFFLENIHWILSEQEITKEDISNYTEIMKSNISDPDISEPAKLIYMRRFFEATEWKNWEYELLSNLIHKRESPIKNTENWDKAMSEDEINKITEQISKYMDNFNYQTLLNLFQDDEQMIQFYQNSTSNYEKLQIYRIIFDRNLQHNSVVQKFINEVFHIENDYLFQLNPHVYQTVPQYIIDECDKEVEKLKN